MLDDTLGNYIGSEYKIELFEEAKTNHAWRFPIPKLRQETVKVKIQWWIKICVSKCKNDSKWTTPTSIIHKKNKTAHFIFDFRELD